MAAESGLKRLMLAFGMRFNHVQDRPAERADREHADKIWERFETYRCGHHQGSTYTLPTVNPFTENSISVILNMFAVILSGFFFVHFTL